MSAVFAFWTSREYIAVFEEVRIVQYEIFSQSDMLVSTNLRVAKPPFPAGPVASEPYFKPVFSGGISPALYHRASLWKHEWRQSRQSSSSCRQLWNQRICHRAFHDLSRASISSCLWIGLSRIYLHRLWRYS